MLSKFSVLMMMLLIATAASLIGISSIVYEPANGACAPPLPPWCVTQHTTGTKGPVGTGVKPPITQQQEQKLLQLTPKALGKGQVLKQQTGITETLVGKISTFLVYAS